MTILKIGQSIEENYTLWRYMSLDKLINLLSTNSLFFTPLSSYRETDPFEGLLPKNALTFLQEIFQEKSIENSIDAFISTKDIPIKTHNLINELITQSNQTQKDLIKKYYRTIADAQLVNCWHANNRESEAMWRLYSDNGKGIAITTNIELLIKAFQDTDTDKTINVGKVRYLDFDNHNFSISDCTVDGYILPLIKRDSFRHENEVRIHTSFDLFGKSLDEVQITPCVLPVNVSALIEQIYISPYAKEPFVSSTKEICKLYNIDEDKIIISNLLNSTDWFNQVI